MPSVPWTYRFQIQALTSTRSSLEIQTPDFLGLLSLITGLLTAYGLDVQRADIQTHGEEAVDRFEVQYSGNINWQKFEKEMAAFLERAYRGESVQSELHRKIIQRLRESPTQNRDTLHPIDLQMDQSDSDQTTLVSLHSQDTPAFLFELTNALALLKINIVRMEVDTVDGKIRDRLWLNAGGKKIISQKEIRSLQWAVLFVKQFTHLLPFVPDPLQALDQFDRLGKDLFERPDFEAMLLTLNEPSALKHLSQVLGTSRFLWEEFIRFQYETLIPFFKDNQFLKIKKPKKQMAEELRERISRAQAFEKKVELLNEFKDEEMFRIDLRHILGGAPYLGEFTEEFTDLAETVVESALMLAWQNTIESQRPNPLVHAENMQMAVLGLGKFGGRELGYASDLEVLFVYQEASEVEAEEANQNSEFYSHVVRQFRKIIHSRSEGVFEIDLRLRPFGKDGPLAISLGGFGQYYRAEGDAWTFERQSLVKLRFIAGDAKLGRRIEQIKDEFVFGEQSFSFQEAFELRVRQQHEHAGSVTFNAKYSSGGLIDVEYLIQTLQIAYGRKIGGDVRHPNTLKAMRALWQSGILKEKHFQDLRACYIFLRGLINALRIVRGHALDLALPEEASEEFMLLGRRLGFYGTDTQVRSQFKLIYRYYRDLTSRLYETWMENLAKMSWPKIPEGVTALPSVLRISLDDWLRGDLNQEQTAVLSALGFRKPEESVSLVKRLCPEAPLFEYFARAMDHAWPLWGNIPDPDEALRYFAIYVENFQDRTLLWRSLAEDPDGVNIFLSLFGSSRYLSELVILDPDNFFWIRQKDLLTADKTKELLSDLKKAPMNLEALRSFRHRETLRLAIVEMFNLDSLESIYEAFSGLADFVLQHLVVHLALEKKIAVMAFGKLGARELNFSSDIDLLFIGDDEADPVKLVPEIQNLLQILKEGTLQEFLYRADCRLRPHGQDGRLFLGLSDTLNYYRSEAEPWEIQALIKIRPIAGRLDLAERFMTEMGMSIWQRDWNEEVLGEIRKVKALYEKRTADRGETYLDIKLGAGGIRDIEFTVQMLQLQKGRSDTALRQAHTLIALDAIGESRFLSMPECKMLRESYLFLRRIENKLHLYDNRQIFTLPADHLRLRSLAKSLGIKDQDMRSAEENLSIQMRETMQACRQIFEKVFLSSERN